MLSKWLYHRKGKIIFWYHDDEFYPKSKFHLPEFPLFRNVSQYFSSYLRWDSWGCANLRNRQYTIWIHKSQYTITNRSILGKLWQIFMYFTKNDGTSAVFSNSPHYAASKENKKWIPHVFRICNLSQILK